MDPQSHMATWELPGTRSCLAAASAAAVAAADVVACAADLAAVEPRYPVDKINK